MWTLITRDTSIVIQPGTAITRYNIQCDHIQYCNGRSRTWVTLWTHRRKDAISCHGRAMGCLIRGNGCLHKRCKRVPEFAGNSFEPTKTSIVTPTCSGMDNFQHIYHYIVNVWINYSVIFTGIAKIATGRWMTIRELKQNNIKVSLKVQYLALWYPFENLLYLYQSCLPNLRETWSLISSKFDLF